MAIGYFFLGVRVIRRREQKCGFVLDATTYIYIYIYIYIYMTQVLGKE
jgi:hypothetical protein